MRLKSPDLSGARPLLLLSMAAGAWGLLALPQSQETPTNYGGACTSDDCTPIGASGIVGALQRRGYALETHDPLPEFNVYVPHNGFCIPSSIRNEIKQDVENPPPAGSCVIIYEQK